MATIRLRLEAILRCAAAFVLVAGGGWVAKAATLFPSDIRVEIATNLVWLDNSSDPVVTALDSQQNFFDRLVAESSPLLRITNLSTDKRFLGGQLGLQNSAAEIVDIQFLQAPGKTAWFWTGPDSSTDVNHAHFQFIDPLMPGQTASMRFITAERENGYTMNQNLFSSLPQYGILKIGVDASLSTEEVQFDPVTHTPVGLTTQIKPGFVFDLSTIPVRSYDSGVSEYGISIVPVPVPEPTGFVLAGVALASLVGWRGLARTRAVKLGKV